VSFVRPRELVSFDPRHVTRSPPIVFELGGITNVFVRAGFVLIPVIIYLIKPSGYKQVITYKLQ